MVKNLEIGDVVIVHDNVDISRLGVVYKLSYMVPDDEEGQYVYVVEYQENTERFWATGAYSANIIPLGFKLDGLIDAYSKWLADGCWRNTKHDNFNNFMHSLKKIRKKHRKKVKERCE